MPDQAYLEVDKEKQFLYKIESSMNLHGILCDIDKPETTFSKTEAHVKTGAPPHNVEICVIFIVAVLQPQL